MINYRLLTIPLCIYLSGLILYSSLFILSDNQSDVVQVGKIFVASVFNLFALIFVFLAQARYLALRILGYSGLVAYFGYVFFLTGYFSYFGFVPEVYTFGFGNATDVGGVANHYLQEIFGLREVFLLIAFAAILILVPRYTLPKRMLGLLLLPMALFVVNIGQFGNPANTDNFGNTSVIRRFGLPTFYFLSAKEWMGFRSGFLAERTDFPGKVSKLASQDPIEFNEEKRSIPDSVDRVVLVQIESLDKEALSAVLNGRTVMPFVSYLRNTSCQDYTNFYTTKSVGGSSDSEFSVVTGRLPSSKQQSIRNFDFTQIQTLYDHLAKAGISSFFAHNNNIGFYGRNFAYEQLLNVNSTFIRPNENVRERDFAIQTLENALTGSTKTFYYFFNFQSHGPFQGYGSDTRNHFEIGNSPNTLTNYLAAMYEVDGTIEAMFDLQRAEFEAGVSLFIITSDHPSYLHTDSTFISRNHIPLLVCHASFEAEHRTKVASKIDLFPTVLDAFGLPTNIEVLGDSLFRDVPGIVLFPQGIILERREDGSLETKSCDLTCAKFYDFTDQAVKLAN